MGVIDGTIVHLAWTEPSMSNHVTVIFSDAGGALDTMLSTCPMTFVRI